MKLGPAKIVLVCTLPVVAILFLAPARWLPAASPDLAFKPAGKGLYQFDTGTLRGRLKVDGKYQGVYPLVDSATGTNLVHPPGVFSLYRVFSGKVRFGNAARDWPTEPRLLPDGAVQVRWPAAEDHPVEIVAVYRWTDAEVLDLELAVTPRRHMPKFELFLSSYFGKGFRGAVYLKPEGGSQEQPRFVPIDKTPGAAGRYVMFPRDDRAVEWIEDGRWQAGANPVDWDIERAFAAPLALRRDAALGITCALMSRRADCFAVASPWNPATPTAGGYRSLYLSLFGYDVKADQTARACCRLVIARGLSDQQVLGRYEAFVAQQAK